MFTGVSDKSLTKRCLGQCPIDTGCPELQPSICMNPLREVQDGLVSLSQWLV